MTPGELGLDPALEACGLNVAGALRVRDYDAIVTAAWRSAALLPSARTVYVIGSGGASFHAQAIQRAPDVAHPLDDACEAQVGAVAERMNRAGCTSRALFYWERRGEEGECVFADFVAIAHAAGLGARSRLGLLLHPRHGPWFAIRALLLSEREAPVARRMPVPDFCSDCAAPCTAACPAGAVTRAGISLDRCSESRHSDPRCASRCDARLACPVGADSRYPPAALAHHMTSHFRDAGSSG